MKRPDICLRTDILDAWLRVSNRTKAELARQLGVTKGRVSQLFASPTGASTHLVAKLLLVTGLPFDRLFLIVTDHEPGDLLRHPRRGMAPDSTHAHA